MNNKTPNYYMIPGDPMKKLDTPGGFSYKATTTMNKLGMGPINDGHDAMANMGHDTPTNDGHSPIDKHIPGHEETENDESFGNPGSGMQANAGQRKFNVGNKVLKANVGKEYGATDLAVEIPKIYIT